MVLPESVFDLGESVIREMTRLAERTGAVNLAQGIPEHPPDPHVIAAAKAALDEPAWQQYSVTWGVAELRRAVAERAADTRGLPVGTFDPDRETTITAGTMEALHAATRALFGPGDEVILIEPYFENYLPYVLLAGATPVPVPSHPDGTLDIDRLTAAFGPKTKGLLLNTPNNPTGHISTHHELTALSDLLVDHDAWLVTDEIYEEIVYPPHEHVSPVAIDGMRERTVVCSGFSKTYNVTGWRTGYAIAPPAVTDRIRAVHDYVVGCAPHPLQRALLAALELPRSHHDEQKRRFQEARERMVGILGTIGLQAAPPEGAYYLWCDIKDHEVPGVPHGADDRAFAYALAETVGVACVPGTCFYVSDEGRAIGRGRVRFAYPKTPRTLDEVEKRLMAAG